MSNKSYEESTYIKNIKDKVYFMFLCVSELTCGLDNDLDNLPTIPNEQEVKKPPKREDETEDDSRHPTAVPPFTRIKSTTPRTTSTITTTPIPPSDPIISRTSTTTMRTTISQPTRPVIISSTAKPIQRYPLSTKETTSTSTTATPTTTPRPSTTTKRGSVVVSRTTVPPWRSNSNSQQRPPLVLGFPNHSSKHEEVQEVLVRSAYRQDNSVIIQWDSETANILGFRVVYRLFGDKSFKQGPPLEASEREFKIKNVPVQVCINCLFHMVECSN
jgi:Predicted solute binding protein